MYVRKCADTMIHFAPTDDCRCRHLISIRFRLDDFVFYDDDDVDRYVWFPRRAARVSYICPNTDVDICIVRKQISRDCVHTFDSRTHLTRNEIIFTVTREIMLLTTCLLKRKKRKESLSFDKILPPSFLMQHSLRDKKGVFTRNILMSLFTLIQQQMYP